MAFGPSQVLLFKFGRLSVITTSCSTDGVRYVKLQLCMLRYAIAILNDRDLFSFKRCMTFFFHQVTSHSVDNERLLFVFLSIWVLLTTAVRIKYVKYCGKKEMKLYLDTPILTPPPLPASTKQRA